MLVSDSRQIIFIHCRKVAGSSVKIALAPHLKGTDFVVGSLNEIIESGAPIPPSLNKILARVDSQVLLCAARVLGKSNPEAKNIVVKKYYERFLGDNPPHPTAQTASLFLRERWDKYKKFCFVRNPFSQVASDYFWRRRSTGLQFEFRDFLALLRKRDFSSGIIHPNGISNWEMISINDEVQCDFVGRYESFNEDFAFIADQLKLPLSTLTATAKVTPGQRDYGALYGASEVTQVKEMFAKEIEYFGYTYPY